MSMHQSLLVYKICFLVLFVSGCQSSGSQNLALNKDTSYSKHFNLNQTHLGVDGNETTSVTSFLSPTQNHSVGFVIDLKEIYKIGLVRVSFAANCTRSTFLLIKCQTWEKLSEKVHFDCHIHEYISKEQFTLEYMSSEVEFNCKNKDNKSLVGIFGPPNCLLIVKEVFVEKDLSIESYANSHLQGKGFPILTFILPFYLTHLLSNSF